MQIAASFQQLDVAIDESRHDGVAIQTISQPETEALSLHEGNIARYRIRPAEYAAWRTVWT